ncbi:MAG: hypothetical protein GY861_23250 [bacterium]|nr:hypothetical protein [bacterium]
MFYTNESSKALRFGDVVKGFITSTPQIESPSPTSLHANCTIHVDSTQLAIVMTPCCSIRDKTISLTPLSGILPRYFLNSYFKEDLTRINRTMSPQNTLPAQAWDKLKQEEKERRIQEGEVYAETNIFIYALHDLLPKYQYSKKSSELTNYHMIDFKATYQVICNDIITPDNSPFDSKILELSIETRAELRNKVASYYGRTPQADEILS